jgi:hypothetical protein
MGPADLMRNEEMLTAQTVIGFIRFMLFDHGAGPYFFAIGYARYGDGGRLPISRSMGKNIVGMNQPSSYFYEVIFGFSRELVISLQ